MLLFRIVFITNETSYSYTNIIMGRALYLVKFVLICTSLAGSFLLLLFAILWELNKSGYLPTSKTFKRLRQSTIERDSTALQEESVPYITINVRKASSQLESMASVSFKADKTGGRNSYISMDLPTNVLSITDCPTVHKGNEESPVNPK
uniref:Uncharacterized protein n=1 Tax=Ciona intestinalis TaxID=7719 RepID=Q69HQ1_CIOIN|nr:uncharacterized protein LOC494380 [Ciona intestinalis]AAP91730.1 hypothetical protein cihA4I22 [Ciona intestinalis]|eukprot:NP_001231975.1 uncharacterized protein LOC494380 [Ciona intestinalis]